MKTAEQIKKRIDAIQNDESGGYVEHIDWLCDSLTLAVEALEVQRRDWHYLPDECSVECVTTCEALGKINGGVE